MSEAGKKGLVVLANGCFDILHVGHVRHLQEARAMGGYLVVSLTKDENVNKGPGRPVNPWLDRADVLRALRPVDQVIETASALQAIYTVRPNIFVKGIDYAGGERLSEDIFAACKEVGAEIRYTTSEKRSVTETIKKALQNAEERWAILDLPVPMEPVCVDLSRPLEEQLMPGYLEAARKLLKETAERKP